MQLVQVFVLDLYYVIPLIDPQGKLKVSTGYFSNTINQLLVYFTFFNALFIAQNLGYAINITHFLVPGVGVTFYSIGHFLAKAEINWVYGIRTP